ncbi:helix-turn-helix transcriptional regulator [Methylopila sp. M107]|uniref:helix-turn-helix domain-containing protein n=1 Tax=Methylopila sp. M107 TaxID=1101190 RepID=UPI00036C7F87|nr:helix-turn-helix transcriptional regulator [Methylopila sp. M107]
MNAQTFTTPSGEEMVILSRADYDALLARIEEAEEDAADVAAYDAAKAADDGRRHAVSPDEVRGHYLRMRRKTVGLTQAELAAQTSLTQGYVSDLEAGRRRPSADAFARIANVLAIQGDELANLRDGYGLG